MDFFTATQYRMAGYSKDETEAIGIAWEQVPEPIEIILKRDGQIYCDGMMTQMQIEYGPELATANGVPVVILEPLPNGQYRWHEIYNPDGVDVVREQVFQNTLDAIKRKKRDDFYAQQAAQQEAQQAMEAENMEQEEGAQKLIRNNADRLVQNASATLLFLTLRDGKPEAAAKLEFPEVRVELLNAEGVAKFRRRFPECFRDDNAQEKS